jgi:hypothetical protein
MVAKVASEVAFGLRCAIYMQARAGGDFTVALAQTSPVMWVVGDYFFALTAVRASATCFGAQCAHLADNVFTVTENTSKGKD